MLLTTTSLLAGLVAFTAAADVAQAPLQSTVSHKKLKLNSTMKMNSGHHIPILGFGVWQTYDLPMPMMMF